MKQSIILAYIYIYTLDEVLSNKFTNLRAVSLGLSPGFLLSRLISLNLSIFGQSALQCTINKFYNEM